MKRKRAFITGASGGIGKAFVLRLAEEGYEITGVARNEEKLKNIKNELGSRFSYLTGDLTEKDTLEKVEKHLAENRCNLLVNNAGYSIHSGFTGLPIDIHENIIALNINALIRLSYVFLRNAGQGDALVNVSSALSRLAYPGGAVYSGTKGFVTTFTESLWYEFREKGVYITALMPGLTFTDFHKRALGDKEQQITRGAGYPAEKVVEETMKELKRRKKPSFITGRKVRFLTWFADKMISRKMMIFFMGKNNPVLKGK